MLIVGRAFNVILFVVLCLICIALKLMSCLIGISLSLITERLFDCLTIIIILGPKRVKDLPFTIAGIKNTKGNVMQELSRLGIYYLYSLYYYYLYSLYYYYYLPPCLFCQVTRRNAISFSSSTIIPTLLLLQYMVIITKSKIRVLVVSGYQHNRMTMSRYTII